MSRQNDGDVAVATRTERHLGRDLQQAVRPVLMLHEVRLVPAGVALAVRRQEYTVRVIRPARTRPANVISPVRAVVGPPVSP
jgi:hypothetical protein